MSSINSYSKTITTYPNFFNNEQPSENTNIYYNDYTVDTDTDNQTNCQDGTLENCLVSEHHSLFFGKDLKYYHYPNHWMKLPNHFKTNKWRGNN